jgi:hypothetical protein
MNTRAWSRAVSLMMIGIMLSLSAGCKSSRWGGRSNPELEEAKVVKEREYVEQVIEVKQRERRWSWKRDRSLLDPCWAP